MPFEHLTRYHLLHNGKETATLFKEGDASLGRSADFVYLAGLSFQSLAAQRHLLAFVGNACRADG